jgi:site-specific DNA-methyltransferase (adenine-specific)
MSHLSEVTNPLPTAYHQLSSFDALTDHHPTEYPGVYFLCFNTDHKAIYEENDLESVINWVDIHPTSSTICFMASAPTAVSIISAVQYRLHYQLWIAVKQPTEKNSSVLPNEHFAIVVMTAYSGMLRHTKTRIRYNFCAACGKTTKDYGGKKHVYHEYGTLISDVWRDIECDPHGDLSIIIERMQDLFGVDRYRELTILDFRHLKVNETLQNTSVSVAKLDHYQEAISNYPESRLLNGDCLNELAEITSESIDFCFADPPYNLKKTYDEWKDTLSIDTYFNWCDRWLSELVRVLKPGRSLAILNIPLWAVRHFKHLENIATFQSWIVWDALGFPVRMIMPAHYSIIVFSKGESRSLPGFTAVGLSSQERSALTPLPEQYCLRANCITHYRRPNRFGELTDLWPDIHRLKHNSHRVDHPTQLPPELMRRLIALYTNPLESVLDCFNGSGTTTLVAQEMDRRYIGIELSSEYHKLAQSRHELLKDGGNPFAKNDSIPNAKNSRVQRLVKMKYLVPKKTLQLDVKRIAIELGRLPTRNEVELMSRYPISLYNQYFLSWGEVCAAARTTGMSEMQPESRTANRQLEIV